MADLYKKITVPSGENIQPTTTNRAYKGIAQLILRTTANHCLI